MLGSAAVFYFLRPLSHCRMQKMIFATTPAATETRKVIKVSIFGFTYFPIKKTETEWQHKNYIILCIILSRKTIAYNIMNIRKKLDKNIFIWYNLGIENKIPRRTLRGRFCLNVILINNKLLHFSYCHIDRLNIFFPAICNN